MDSVNRWLEKEKKSKNIASFSRRIKRQKKRRPKWNRLYHPRRSRRVDADGAGESRKTKKSVCFSRRIKKRLPKWNRLYHPRRSKRVNADGAGESRKTKKSVCFSRWIKKRQPKWNRLYHPRQSKRLDADGAGESRKTKKSVCFSRRIKKRLPKWNRWPHARVATPLSPASIVTASRQTEQETEEGPASPRSSRFSDSFIAEVPGMERERERESENEKTNLVLEGGSFQRFIGWWYFKFSLFLFNKNSPLKGNNILFIILSVWLSKLKHKSPLFILLLLFLFQINENSKIFQIYSFIGRLQIIIWMTSISLSYPPLIKSIDVDHLELFAKQVTALSCSMFWWRYFLATPRE